MILRSVVTRTVSLRLRGRGIRGPGIQRYSQANSLRYKCLIRITAQHNRQRAQNDFKIQQQ